MKLFSSSPDKFPPHATRSLRSNAASRSHRAPPSTPMLFRRRASANAALPEPGSPEVTCIGQIRVTNRPSSSRGCRCFRRAAALFPAKRGKLSGWRGWLCLFGRNREPAPACVDKWAAGIETTVREEEAGEDMGGMSRREVVVVGPAPPKNALLLMRSRSEARPSWAADRRPAVEAAGEEEAKRVRDEGSGTSGTSRKSEDVVRSEPFILTRSRSEPGMRRLPDSAELWKLTELELGRCR